MLYLKSFTLTFYYKALNEQKWIYEIREESSEAISPKVIERSEKTQSQRKEKL